MCNDLRFQQKILEIFLSRFVFFPHIIIEDLFSFLQNEQYIEVAIFYGQTTHMQMTFVPCSHGKSGRQKEKN